MKIPVEISEETLFQLKELNAKEGCEGRSDLELLSDMIRNIVDLSYRTFAAEENENELAPIKRSIEDYYEEAQKARSGVVPFPAHSCDK